MSCPVAFELAPGVCPGAPGETRRSPGAWVTAPGVPLGCTGVPPCAPDAPGEPTAVPGDATFALVTVAVTWVLIALDRTDGGLADSVGTVACGSIAPSAL